jgi:hypothetical protein
MDRALQVTRIALRFAVAVSAADKYKVTTVVFCGEETAKNQDVSQRGHLPSPRQEASALHDQAPDGRFGARLEELLILTGRAVGRIVRALLVRSP